MPLFLEPSAWVKLYVEEPGTEAMKTLFARPDLRDEFFASPAVALEMYGRLAKSLRIEEERIGQRLHAETDPRRRKNLGKTLRRANQRKYRTAVQEFERDYQVGANLVEVNDAILRETLMLAKTYAMRDASALDLVHLATLEHLSTRLQREGISGDIVFVLSDGPLKRIASDRGVSVWDPLYDDPADVVPPSLL